MDFFRCLSLLLFLLFLFKSSNGQIYSEEEEEEEEEHYEDDNTITTTTTSRSSFLDESPEHLFEYEEILSTDRTSMISSKENDQIDDLNNENEYQDQTKFEISTSTLKTKRIESEIVSTKDSFSMNREVLYSPTETNDIHSFDRRVIEKNRGSFILKMYSIGVIVFMSSLVVLLIILHLIQNKRRYGKYQSPSNLSSTNQL